MRIASSSAQLAEVDDVARRALIERRCDVLAAEVGPDDVGVVPRRGGAQEFARLIDRDVELRPGKEALERPPSVRRE